MWFGITCLRQSSPPYRASGQAFLKDHRFPLTPPNTLTPRGAVSWKVSARPQQWAKVSQRARQNSIEAVLLFFFFFLQHIIVSSDLHVFQSHFFNSYSSFSEQWMMHQSKKEKVHFKHGKSILYNTNEITVFSNSKCSYLFYVNTCKSEFDWHDQRRFIVTEKKSRICCPMIITASQQFSVLASRLLPFSYLIQEKIWDYCNSSLLCELHICGSIKVCTETGWLIALQVIWANVPSKDLEYLL